MSRPPGEEGPVHLPAEPEAPDPQPTQTETEAQAMTATGAIESAIQERLNEAEAELVILRDALSRQAAVTNWLCEHDPELKAKINAFIVGWTRAKRS